ncbi:hypothetical protein [Pararhodobacter sp. CCB-MM2]|uniref:hypothetical protein n=1 Tax=Pararhodobacter sp. CCB-MM2 TaxID=1786003 RepID=UPI00082BFAC8|nr:hypothetical protein [Pararhodobacter sp. CCB-MM2]
MIRAFLLFLGLWLGLCLAVLLGGTVGHLRQLSDWTGWALPAWTEGLDADAGFRHGAGRLEGARLSWALSGLSGFDVRLSGPDWQASGFATPEGASLRVDQLAGLVPLTWLQAGPGLLSLDGGQLRLGLDGTIDDGQLQGQARGSEPEGAVTLDWTGDGWALAAR